MHIENIESNQINLELYKRNRIIYFTTWNLIFIKIDENITNIYKNNIIKNVFCIIQNFYKIKF